MTAVHPLAEDCRTPSSCPLPAVDFVAPCPHGRWTLWRARVVPSPGELSAVVSVTDPLCGCPGPDLVAGEAVGGAARRSPAIADTEPSMALRPGREPSAASLVVTS